MALARKRSDLANRPPPDDEHVGPSAEWGWHGAFPRGVRIAGLAAVLVLAALMFIQDTQQSTMPRLWLGGIAVIVLIGALAYRSRRDRWH